MTFRVGQRVVCVNDSYDVLGRPSRLTKHAIYTIAGFGCERDCVLPIYLCEAKCNYGTGFRPDRFRPLVERKTDISIFKKMLKPQGVDA